MKYLRDDFRNMNPQKPFLWADAGSNPPLESVSERVDIKEIIQKPYTLNLEKLQKLEQQAGSFSNQQQVKLRNLVGYWLTVSQTSVDRPTLEIFRVLDQESPQIQKILGGFYQDKIKNTLQNNADILKTDFLKSELEHKNTEWKHARQFLDFAQKQSDLLPVHLKTLDEILNQDGFDQVKPDGSITRHSLASEARTIRDNYLLQLDQRVQSHTLKASDMEVLLDDETESTVEPEKHELVKKFRNAVSQVMGVQNSDELEETYLTNRYDKYASWFEVDTSKEPDDVETLKKAIDELDIGDSEKQDPLYISLRDGLLKHFGDLVEGKMRKNTIENDTKENVDKTVNSELDNTKDPETETKKDDQSQSESMEQTDESDQNTEPETHTEPEKTASEKIIQTEREDFEKILSDIKNPEEHKKLEPTFDVRTDWFLNGSQTMPGLETIKDARNKTEKLQKEVGGITHSIIKNLVEIDENLKEFEDVEKRIEDFQGSNNIYVKTLINQRTEARKEVVRLFQNLEQNWKNQKHELKNIFEDFEKEVDTDKEGLNDISKKANAEYIDPLNQSFEKLFSTFRAQGMDIRKTPEILSECGYNTDKIKKYAEFGDNFWQEMENAIQNNLQKGNKNITFLKNHQFFDDKQKSKKELQKIQAEYAHKIQQYQTAFLETQKRIKKDLQSYSDQEFQDRYGAPKAEIQSKIERADQDYKNLIQEWNSAKDPQQIENLFEKYEQSVDGITDPKQIQKIQEEKTKAIDKVGEMEQLKDKIQNMSDDTETMNVLLDKDAKERMTESWHHKTNEWLKNDWYFYSLSDVYEFIKTSIEAFKRKEERRSEMAQANLGSQFWNGFGSWIWRSDAGVIAAEFNRRKEEATDKRVGEYESAYKNKKAWELWDIIDRKGSNIDEVQACLNKLNELGALRFDDPVLWKFINRVKGYKYMNIPQDLEDLKLTEITAKVGSALSDIYSQKEFDDWVKTKDSKRNSALGEWVGDYENADIDGKQHAIFVEMLQAWKKGDTEKVEPARFMSYIKEAFTRGQVNGYPDMRFYYLIQAITLKNPKGQTILSPDVLRYLNDSLLQQVPHFDFFKDKTTHKLNGRIVPPGTPGSAVRIWGYKDYLVWAEFMTDANGTFNPKSDELAAKRVGQFFDHFVHMSDDARGRVGRMFAVSKKEWDHDDAWMMIREWTPGNVIDAFRPGAFKSKDWIRGFLGAFPDYMRSMYDYIKQGDAEYGDAEYWKKERQRILLEVGSRLKVGTLGMQMLAGNFLDEAERSKTAIFDENSWRADTGYSTPLIRSRKRINAMMELVIDDMNENQEVDKNVLKDMLSYDAYKISTKGRGLMEFVRGEGPYEGKGEFITDSKGVPKLDENGQKIKNPNYDEEYVKESERYKNIQNASKTFLSETSEEAAGAVFEDTQIIEKALNTYIEKGLYNIQ
jgi:hypothetical protein